MPIYTEQKHAQMQAKEGLMTLREMLASNIYLLKK